MVNYSQPIGEALVMMERPSMVDSPSDGAPVKAPRWDLADTEGYSGGNCVSLAPWMFSGYVVIYRRKKYVGGRPRGPQDRGVYPEEVGTPSCLVTASTASWLALQFLWITFVPKIMLPKVSFRLDSV